MERRRYRLVALGVVAIVVAAGAGIPVVQGMRQRRDATAAARLAGRSRSNDIYVRRCAGCHGPGAEGTAHAPSLQNRIGTWPSFRRTVRRGRGMAMPGFPEIAPQALRQLHAYLAELTAKPRGSIR